MATRLTTFAKLIITMLIVGAVVLGGWFIKQSGLLNDFASTDGSTNSKPITNGKPLKGGSDDGTINVGVVTWGGYAGGQYFNEGFQANTKSRYYKDYGLKVNFKVLDDFVASRKAFENDEVHLLWCTIDAFPTESGGLSGDPQIVFQADWSRGGDAIVVRRGISSIKDLKGKKVSVAMMTPSHSFLIWLLEAAGMSIRDIKPNYVADAVKAAELFKNGEVDAAVVWSPDDESCVREIKGSKILQNTKNASHIIADGFMAKKAWIENNREDLRKLYEGWMIGASEINQSSTAKKKAAQIVGAGLNIPVEDALGAIDNVRLATHGDNMDFFGFNTNYKNQTAESLYNKMKLKYSSLGGEFKEATASAPSWRIVSNPSAVRSAQGLTGAQHRSETIKFTKATKQQETATAIATKAVSISFRSGEYKLDENAKYIIDKEFADIAKSFSNTRVRIEGNTDDVGQLSSNVILSRKRANSVADYLKSEYGMDPNRFIVVGNGPNKPVCRDKSSSCRSKNRRTDFELVGG